MPRVTPFVTQNGLRRQGTQDIVVFSWQTTIYLDVRVEMEWTDTRAAKLGKLWGEGLSASQIADRLGGTTRNAVIG